jgi:hypothetical protein
MTNTSSDGIQVNGVANSNANAQSWFDYAGNPIAAVGQVGGFKVFGDDISTYAPGSITVPSTVLHKGGGVTIAVNGPTLYGGKGKPTFAATVGDYFFRTDSTLQWQHVYQYQASGWVGVC